ALSRTLAAALFKPSADNLTLGSAPGQLTFEYSDVSGLHARKTFYFQPDIGAVAHAGRRPLQAQRGQSDARLRARAADVRIQRRVRSACPQDVLFPARYRRCRARWPPPSSSPARTI